MPSKTFLKSSNESVLKERIRNYKEKVNSTRVGGEVDSGNGRLRKWNIMKFSLDNSSLEDLMFSPKKKNFQRAALKGSKRLTKLAVLILTLLFIS